MSKKSSKNSDVVKMQSDESTASMADSEKSSRTAAQNSAQFSHTQNKHELKNLDDRFATHINQLKDLETKNSKLTQEIHSLKEVTPPELSNIKALLKSENDGLKNALDQETKQKNQLKMQNRCNILKAEKLKKKFDQITKDLKKAKPYIAKVNKLNNKYRTTLTENKNLKKTHNKYVRALKTEKTKLEHIRYKLRYEKIIKVTNETKIQRMKEKFRLKEEALKQQINDATSRHTEIISEVDGPQINENEDYSKTGFIPLRSQTEENFAQEVTEISELNFRKLQDLENEIQNKKKAVELLQKTICTTNARLSEITQELNDLLAYFNYRSEQTAESKQTTENKRIKYTSEIQTLNQQLVVMQEDKSQKEQEYAKLMQIQIIMGMKVDAEKKLLDTQTEYLSIISNTPLNEASH